MLCDILLVWAGRRTAPRNWTCWSAPTTSCWSWPAAGAKGWVAGLPNALPQVTTALFRAAVAGDPAAQPLYRALHPLMRWDSRTEFVQAVKVSMDVAGRYGGPCRPPRQPLLPEQEKAVRAATEQALAAGAN